MANRAIAVEERVVSTVNALGYELVGCEWAQHYGATVLRIYIDSPNGIMLKDCEKVSKQLSVLLDVEEPIAEHYQLEVSSPGLERPLFTIDHYQQFIGHKVKLRLYKPINKQRRLTGEIVATDGASESVTLAVDSEHVLVPLDRIDKANLVAQFEDGIHE